MICDTDQHIIKIATRDAYQQHAFEYVAEFLMFLYEIPSKERINGDYVHVHFALTHAETKKDLDTRYWDFEVDLASSRLKCIIHNRDYMIMFVKEIMKAKIEETNYKFPSYFLRPSLIY